ncbi:MAG: hypothetical protein PUH24_02815 [Prevotellaceae bacterium]|nr:hypothetical protein [Prevotella sp.]MDD7257200.1 hypothetical protein [Prevotellaceae bacterium]MDY6129946.1 hypothetical protein [Prevotella sp.]
MDMKYIVKMAVAALLLAAHTETKAQDSLEVDFKIDLVSNHLWRGQDYGNVSAQPSGEIKYKGIYAQAFGSTGFTKEDMERIDLTLGYTHWGFNAGVTSHWTSGKDPLNRYFFFKEKETGHKIEGNIGYTCRYFSLQAYTIFLGNDFKLDGNRAYSTYIELTAPFRLAGVDWRAQVGFTPMESAGYKTEVKGLFLVESINDYLYAEGPRVVSASLRATKAFNVGKYEIPLFMELNVNPYTQKAYGMAGVTFHPFAKK